MLLIAFWLLKWAKNEGGSCLVHGKASWSSKHEESKSWRVAKPFPNQSSEQGRESEKESNMQQFRTTLQNFRKLAKCPRWVQAVGQRANCAEGISQPLVKFLQDLFPCETGENEFRKACEKFTTLRNQSRRKWISQPCEILPM